MIVKQEGLDEKMSDQQQGFINSGQETNAFSVAHIGILVADVIAKPVDTIPERGKLGLVEGLSLANGGCAMTAAVNMATIGLKTALIGKIGRDGFGSYLTGVLQDAGVNIDGLVVQNGAATSASVALIDSGGERTFLHCQGANAEFCEQDIAYDIIKKSGIVFVAGTMLMPAFDGAQCKTFLEKAKALGKTTALDTAWDSKGRWMELLAPCLPYVDYFMPSYEEAVCLAGDLTDPEAIATLFFEKGVTTAVVIKMGKDGCFIKESLHSAGYSLPAYTHIVPVDTTGAGDSFCSGFLSGLSLGRPLVDCGKLGNAAGAHCVMATGATRGMRPLDVLDAFIAQNE